MQPEHVIDSFFKIINNQPELFMGEAKQDLSQLEMAVDRVEQLPKADQTEFLADAIIDFCDFNPLIFQALRENINQVPDENAPAITEEQQFLLSKKIQSLIAES